jgi:hypothetical protein
VSNDDLITDDSAKELKRKTDARELEKYLLHCERVVIEHMREKGWPVDLYNIHLVWTRRGP